MKNKLICFIMTVFALFVLSSAVYADEEIKLKINGEELATDVPPLIINGRTMVPVRAIFEGVGADVGYDDVSKTITGVKGNTTVTMQINGATAFIDEVEYPLESSPVIVDGRTLAPARFVAESFGCEVEWDSENRIVIITSESMQLTEETTVTETTTEATTQTTTEKTTETTTQTTTNQTTTQEVSISAPLLNKVRNDLSLAVNGYSIGNAKNAARLKVAYLENTVKPVWLNLVKNDTDKKFYNAAATAYRRYIDYALGIDYYYTTWPYNKYDETDRDCRNCKKAIVDNMNTILSSKDLEEIKKCCEEMKKSYDSFKNRMIILKGNS